LGAGPGTITAAGLAGGGAADGFTMGATTAGGFAGLGGLPEESGGVAMERA